MFSEIPWTMGGRGGGVKTQENYFYGKVFVYYDI